MQKLKGICSIANISELTENNNIEILKQGQNFNTTTIFKIKSKTITIKSGFIGWIRQCYD